MGSFTRMIVMIMVGPANTAENGVRIVSSFDPGFLFMMMDGNWQERKKPGDGQAFYEGGWIVSGLNDRDYMDGIQSCQST